MEIEKIALSHLRNEEHFKFMTDFSGLVLKFTPAALDIAPLFKAFQTVFEKESGAIDVILKSAITTDIADTDAQRDMTYSGLAGSVKSAANHFKPEVRAAAARLQVVFDHYGNISEKPYDQETAAILQLVADLQGNYSVDAATVGLTEWVAELQKQNLAFDELKKARNSENAVKPQQNLKQARAEVDTSYRDIVRRVDALVEVKGETAYAAFIKELNELVGGYNTLIAQRQGRNAKKTNETKNIN